MQMNLWYRGVWYKYPQSKQWSTKHIQWQIERPYNFIPHFLTTPAPHRRYFFSHSGKVRNKLRRLLEVIDSSVKASPVSLDRSQISFFFFLRKKKNLQIYLLTNRFETSPFQEPLLSTISSNPILQNPWISTGVTVYQWTVKILWKVPGSLVKGQEVILSFVLLSRTRKRT